MNIIEELKKQAIEVIVGYESDGYAVQVLQKTDRHTHLPVQGALFLAVKILKRSFILSFSEVRTVDFLDGGREKASTLHIRCMNVDDIRIIDLPSNGNFMNLVQVVLEKFLEVKT